MKTTYLLALATAGAGGLMACGPKTAPDAPDQAPVKTSASAPAPKPAENDDRIEATFKKTYVYKTYLKDEKIALAAKDGAVVLTGTVAVENHKRMAAETVEALPGVKSVQNNIQVTGVPAAVNTDPWVAAGVNSALLMHRNVNAGKTTIVVKDGVVTLHGEASSQAQKDLTTEYAKDVEGVKEVTNEMTVATTPAKPDQSVGEAIDDASITAQIKISLLVHRSTSSVKTKVKSTDGVVTLSGEAKNGAEKDLVTKLVADINGVKSVVNNMTIAVPAH